MILDFHTHTYPRGLAERVIQNAAKLGVKSYTDATVPALKQSMRQAGITHAVVLSIATRPGQTARIIGSALEMLQQERDSTGPRLIPFVGIHPMEDGWREHLHRVKELGFTGIKLHPDYQGFYIDDANLEPFYREVAALGLIMVFHAGLDVVSPDDVHATAARIYNVLPLLERTPTVLAHMGGYKQEREVLELLCGRNVYLDTSFNLKAMDQEMARAIVRKHGPEKILFGTDSPWCEQRDWVAFFRDRFAPGLLSEAHTHDILWRNGARLLRLDR